MANWGNALGGGTGGALGGALTGASIGSIFPGIGTLVGGLVGGGLGAFGGAAPGLFEQSQQSMPGQQGQVPGQQQGNWFSGYNAYNQQLPRFTPEQQSGLSMLLQQGLQNSNFGGIENLARQNFQTQTVPSIAERFTSIGNGQRSSAFTGALGQAGAGLESQLAALRGQYGLQQLQMGLQPSFENIYIPQQGGVAQGAAPAVGQFLAQLPLLMQLYNANKIAGAK